MAEQNEQKKSYPMLPVGHWWGLRKKFKQSIPGVVTDGYIATVLNMKENSARANVLPYLKQLGIIDEEGRTGERARLWRDDSQYPQVCKEMLQEIYPAELREAVSDPAERARAESWFANRTGGGESAAGKMAGLYVLLLDADPSKQPDEKARAKNGGQTRAARSKQTARAVPAASATQPAAHVEHHAAGSGSQGQKQLPPGININLQVHISADATTDQIDQIFASMAKHIYQRGV